MMLAQSAKFRLFKLLIIIPLLWITNPEKLIAAGIMTEAGGSAVTGTYPSNVAGARMNYQMCLEDRSKGVHNPKYVKALLTNSIESLQ